MKRASKLHPAQCLLAVLAICGHWAAPSSLLAQAFNPLYSFSGLSTFTNPSGGLYHANSDGSRPNALVLSGSTLYGVASGGGNWGLGTVFAISKDGTGFRTLYSFTLPSAGINSDGISPAGLILSGGTLYGTAFEGGASRVGTVFGINTDGTGFTTLYSFMDGDDGRWPSPNLVLWGGTLYGTAGNGGNSGAGAGTVFAINTDGSGFNILYSFTPVSYSGNLLTNSDGAWPAGGLVLSGKTLYGATANGGSGGHGTIFAVNTDGTGFAVLHTFAGSEGSAPESGLFLSSNTLYGTAFGGGSSGNGTVFKVNTDGTGFRVLHTFSGAEGVSPNALVLSGNTLYGTAYGGGSGQNGTVFAIATDGTSFTSLHSLAAFYAPNTNSDGANPSAALVLSSNALYGTASSGGIFGSGTLFTLSFSPQLTITQSGRNVVLTWPTNFAGFDYTGYSLQSTANLVSPVWSTNSAAPVVVNGQFAVTNPISGAQQFYRLAQ